MQAVTHRDFLMIMSEEDLDGALQRNSGRLVVLFAGATWCGSSRATVTMVKVCGGGEGRSSLNGLRAFCGSFGGCWRVLGGCMV